MPSILTQLFDSETVRVVNEAKQHPLFSMITSTDADQATVFAAIRNVLLRVHLYGPALTESIFHAIGRIATFDVETAKELAAIEWDEATHPALAFKDFLKLGGDSSFKSKTSYSPAAFAVAATMRALANHENPFAILGGFHYLETTTPLFIESIASQIASRRPEALTEFISLHRTQDVEHSATLRQIIGRVAARDEATDKAIAFGFQCFAVVYPFPIWSESLQQTKQDVAKAA